MARPTPELTTLLETALTTAEALVLGHDTEQAATLLENACQTILSEWSTDVPCNRIDSKFIGDDEDTLPIWNPPADYKQTLNPVNMARIETIMTSVTRHGSRNLDIEIALLEAGMLCLLEADDDSIDRITQLPRGPFALPMLLQNIAMPMMNNCAPSEEWLDQGGTRRIERLLRDTAKLRGRNDGNTLDGYLTEDGSGFYMRAVSTGNSSCIQAIANWIRPGRQQILHQISQNNEPTPQQLDDYLRPSVEIIDHNDDSNLITPEDIQQIWEVLREAWRQAAQPAKQEPC